MKQGHFKQHCSDDKGRPAGGVSSGRGFTVSWQNGPLGNGDDYLLLVSARDHLLEARSDLEDDLK